VSINDWFFPAGSLADDLWDAVVDPGAGRWANTASADSAWRHTGIRVASVAAGETRTLPAGDIERIVIPLHGSFAVRTREVDGATGVFELAGRTSVFDGPSDVLYLGVGVAAELSAVGRSGRVAVAEAPASARKPTRYIAREDVQVELRGAGRSSRQVHNFGTPDALDADRFIVCEVITPAENWSSYPAHKHDTHVPGVESTLEEIYYFETDVTRGAIPGGPGSDAFGLFATYASDDRDIQTNALVRTGDIALVPHGFHGPAAAAPGYDLYYLNVMAGPNPERVWNITDDPAHSWVRASWHGQDIDPRLPYGPRPLEVHEIGLD
jgi:5-deoxy-glucuronate isomerase